MASKSPNMLEKTKRSLRQLVEPCGSCSVTDIDRALVLRFRAKQLARKLLPATVNKNLRQIKSALSHAVDAGYLKSNPLLRMKALFLREPEECIRVVERAEFAQLLTATKLPEFRVLMIVQCYTGWPWRLASVRPRYSA